MPPPMPPPANPYAPMPYQHMNPHPPPQYNQPRQVNNFIPHGRTKEKWVAFILCVFLGWAGGHKFYEGRIGMGILYLLTGGLWGIGWLVDIFILLSKPNTYYV
jgi:restriction system protein